MADLQFMSVELSDPVGKTSESTEISPENLNEGWFTMEARGKLSKDQYGRKKLKLEPEAINNAAAPKSAIIMQAGRRQSNYSPEMLFQRL